MKWIQSETNILQNIACVKAIWCTFRYGMWSLFVPFFSFSGQRGPVLLVFDLYVHMTPWEIIHFRLQVAARFQIQHRWQDSKPPTPIITEIHRKITEMKEIVKKKIFLCYLPLFCKLLMNSPPLGTIHSIYSLREPHNTFESGSTILLLRKGTSLALTPWDAFSQLGKPVRANIAVFYIV